MVEFALSASSFAYWSAQFISSNDSNPIEGSAGSREGWDD
jgi:hypothetical protein